jgi:hypothetical protein
MITMKISVTPKYNPKTEKPYFCVPAVLQMIQERRGLEFASQDEIGYQLGLIVPQENAHLFSKVRTGRMPKTGWGTQTSKEQYSINKYFVKNNLPLKLTIYGVQEVGNVSEFVVQNLVNGNDIIVCYNSQLLFGDGDIEQVSLIQEIDTKNDELTIVDLAIGVPKVRKTRLSKLIRVLKTHETSSLGGFWIVLREK